MLFIVDYINPHKSTADCLVVEADFEDDARDIAIDELKNLNIPQRYILKIEEF